MATPPETVGHRMERVKPSPAVIVWRACGEGSWKRSGLSCRLFMVSEEISAINARGGDGETEGDAKWGLLEAGGVASGDGSSQGLIAREDELNPHRGRE